MLIVGPCGTGKSHLAQALGHCAVRQGRTWCLPPAPSCSRASTRPGPSATTSESSSSWPGAAADHRRLWPQTAARPADEDLHDLIAERYEQAATVVTSNLDFTEWDQAFPGNRLLAVPVKSMPLSH